MLTQWSSSYKIEHPEIVTQGSISWDTRQQLHIADWFMDWHHGILWLLLLGGVRENNGVRLIHIIPQTQNRSPSTCKWSKGPPWHCLVCRACPEPLPTIAAWRNGCSKILALAFIFGTNRKNFGLHVLPVFEEEKALKARQCCWQPSNLTSDIFMLLDYVPSTFVRFKQSIFIWHCLCTLYVIDLQVWYS